MPGGSLRSLYTSISPYLTLGIDFKYERARRLPDGRIASVKYGECITWIEHNVIFRL
ncbi:MAG: hypothetical protein LZ172_07745 [Thaumarchaeota archaeon]|jgi:hypothetical protein|nr:hypothetical protein [Candidatus Geocrenenecus arthurdayi]MCL7402232.1 hypothetical protein [Candidatus Geocrenenecus arthurdayi]MCL7404219.1 hypothetical protein [Candidatus Geocrenenecus arthurdayi]